MPIMTEPRLGDTQPSSSRRTLAPVRKSRLRLVSRPPGGPRHGGALIVTGCLDEDNKDDEVEAGVTAAMGVCCLWGL